MSSEFFLLHKYCYSYIISGFSSSIQYSISLLPFHNSCIISLFNQSILAIDAAFKQTHVHRLGFRTLFLCQCRKFTFVHQTEHYYTVCYMPFNFHVYFHVSSITLLSNITCHVKSLAFFTLTLLNQIYHIPFLSTIRPIFFLHSISPSFFHIPYWIHSCFL